MATPIEIGMRIARRVFAKRGNHSEAHVTEGELAAILAIAAEQALADAAVSSSAGRHRDDMVPTRVRVETCAGCGEPWPCSDCRRTDISGRERAKHYRG